MERREEQEHMGKMLGVYRNEMGKGKLEKFRVEESRVRRTGRSHRY